MMLQRLFEAIPAIAAAETDANLFRRHAERCSSNLQPIIKIKIELLIGEPEKGSVFRNSAEIRTDIETAENIGLNELRDS